MTMSILDDVEALKRTPVVRQGRAVAKLKLMAFAAERAEFRKPARRCSTRATLADAAYIILEGRADVVIDTPATAR